MSPAKPKDLPLILLLWQKVNGSHICATFYHPDTCAVGTFWSTSMSDAKIYTLCFGSHRSVSGHPSQILFPDLTFFSGPLSTRQAVCHHPGGHDITSDHFPSVQHWCQINCLYQISHWLLQPLLRKAIMNQCLFTYTNILSWPLWNTPQFLPPSQGETSMSPQVWAEVEASLQKRQVIQGLSLLLTNWVICGPAHSWSQMWQFFHVMNFCCVYLIQI